MHTYHKVKYIYKYTHSLETEAKMERIWGLYSNVDSWPGWDKTLEKVTLDGAFLGGSEGRIKLVNQDWINYKLVEVNPLMGFSNETKVPSTDAVICFGHTITRMPSGKTKITHSVSIDGKDSDKIGKEFGPFLTSRIPETMENLAVLALAIE